MSNDFIVTRAEFNDGMQQQVNNISEVMDVVNALKYTEAMLEKAHNALAEVTGLHRFILEKFVPLPLLEQAVKEYKAEREAIIKAESDASSRSN